MTRTCAVLLLAGFFIQDTAMTRNPWAGFADGSWVIMENTMAVDQDKKTSREKTIVRLTKDGAIRQEVCQEMDGGFGPPGSQRMHLQGSGAEKDAGTASKPKAAELQIGVRKIACEVTEYELKDATKDFEARTIVWRTKEVKIPYREMKRNGSDVALDTDIVQFEMNLKRGADAAAYKFRVVELDLKLKIGSQEVLCALEEGTAEETKGSRVLKATVRQWLSDAVPGRIVRMEVRGESNGKKVERIQRATDFEEKN